MRDVPRLLLHCQHSVGLGHLVRSFTLASALADRFEVTVLCGGELPAGLPLPRDVEVIALPPLGGGQEHVRRDLVLSVFDVRRTAAVVVELFPFGRKKLAGELVPLLVAARRSGAVTACSVRDLLVTRDDDGRHDERASLTANALLDVVLVHADPRLAHLEDSFRPRKPLLVPVHHTGFVARDDRHVEPTAHDPTLRVLVSAGGGRVGGALLHAAVGAHRLLDGVQMTLVAGPFLPASEWRSLPRDVPGLDVRRTVADLRVELAAATASVSQCGYNTTLEVLGSGLPALLVPFSAPGEDEQSRRAAQLAELGAVRVLDPVDLDPARLASEIASLLTFRPRALALDLDGARVSAKILDTLVREQKPAREVSYA